MISRIVMHLGGLIHAVESHLAPPIPALHLKGLPSRLHTTGYHQAALQMSIQAKCLPGLALLTIKCKQQVGHLQASMIFPFQPILSLFWAVSSGLWQAYQGLQWVSTTWSCLQDACLAF